MSLFFYLVKTKVSWYWAGILRERKKNQIFNLIWCHTLAIYLVSKSPIYGSKLERFLSNPEMHLVYGCLCILYLTCIFNCKLYCINSLQNLQKIMADFLLICQQWGFFVLSVRNHRTAINTWRHLYNSCALLKRLSVTMKYINSKILLFIV